VIAPGRRNDASQRHLAGEQVGERAAGLERSRVLQKLELQRQAVRRQAELGAIDFDHRRSPGVGKDQRPALCDRFRSDGSQHRAHCKFLQGRQQLTRISRLAN
jgi:hypothetical protein